MPKYTHSIRRITVVRLPYIYETLANLSTYIENAMENKSHPSVEKTAPGIKSLNLYLRFGRLL